MLSPSLHDGNIPHSLVWSCSAWHHMLEFFVQELGIFQEKSRLRRIAGAISVQVYRAEQTHREAIFTHTLIQPLSICSLPGTCRMHRMSAYVIESDLPTMQHRGRYVPSPHNAAVQM